MSNRGTMGTNFKSSRRANTDIIEILKALNVELVGRSSGSSGRTNRTNTESSDERRNRMDRADAHSTYPQILAQTVVWTKRPRKQSSGRASA